MSKFTTQRNFGFGKQMDWAGHQALKDIYGRGHFGTVASHAQRWRQFCHWARSNYGINDACTVDQSLLESYAADLAERVEDETLAVSYAQNLIVSANITLEALRQDKAIRIESPASYVGKRQTVRTKIPDGTDWSEIDRLVAYLHAKNLHRAAVIVLLCRSFGIRLREAILANLADWQRQAREYGQIDIREGTKGGRGVNGTSKLIQFSHRQRFKTDTPPYRTHARDVSPVARAAGPSGRRHVPRAVHPFAPPFLVCTMPDCC